MFKKLQFLLNNLIFACLYVHQIISISNASNIPEIEIIEIARYNKNVVLKASVEETVQKSFYEGAVGKGYVFEVIKLDWINKTDRNWHLEASEFLFNLSREKDNVHKERCKFPNAILINVGVDTSFENENGKCKNYVSYELPYFFWSGSVINGGTKPDEYWTPETLANHVLKSCPDLKDYFYSQYFAHHERKTKHAQNSIIQLLLQEETNPKDSDNIGSFVGKLEDKLKERVKNFIAEESEAAQVILEKTNSLYPRIVNLSKKRKQYRHYHIVTPNTDDTYDENYMGFIRRIQDTFTLQNYSCDELKRLCIALQPAFEKINKRIELEKEFFKQEKELQSEKKRIKQAIKEHEKENQSIGENFKGCFHQSEQAFLINYQKCMNGAIGAIKSQLRKDIQLIPPFNIHIDRINLNIASYRHICRYCRLSISYEFGIIKDFLAGQLKDNNEEGECFIFDNESLLKIRLSGRESTEMK